MEKRIFLGLIFRKCKQAEIQAGIIVKNGLPAGNFY